MLNKRRVDSNSSRKSIISFLLHKRPARKRPNRYDGKYANVIIKRESPQPKLLVSLGTLIEIEKWVKKANIGKTRYAFDPIMKQIEYNGDRLDDVTHSMTLAQIMPFAEIRRSLHAHAMSPYDDRDLAYTLAKKYRTTQKNAMERIHQVRQINNYLKEQKKLADDGPFKD